MRLAFFLQPDTHSAVILSHTRPATAKGACLLLAGATDSLEFSLEDGWSNAPVFFPCISGAAIGRWTPCRRSLYFLSCRAAGILNRCRRAIFLKPT